MALAVAGCVTAPHAHRLREAEDAFSAGARIENAEKVLPASDAEILAGAAAPQMSAQQYYATAYGLASEALRTSEADLRRDDLWGTAKTLRALAAWRLGDTDRARADAGEVVAAADAAVAARSAAAGIGTAAAPGTAEAPGTAGTPRTAGIDANGTRIWPRDLALCRAVTALAQIDALAARADAMRPGKTTSAALQAGVFDHVSGVTGALDAAAKEVPDGHPLRVYLVLCRAQLAHVVLRALSHVDAADRTPEQRAGYMTLRDDVLQRLDAAAAATSDREHAAMLKLVTRYRTVLQDM